jgi:hypothetical protein
MDFDSLEDPFFYFIYSLNVSCDRPDLYLLEFGGLILICKKRFNHTIYMCRF